MYGHGSNVHGAVSFTTVAAMAVMAAIAVTAPAMPNGAMTILGKCPWG